MATPTSDPSFDPHVLRARVNKDRMGFLTAEDVARLGAHPHSRLWLVLVRCGGCRFLASAQDVAHLMRCVVAGGDYVRDVSFPALGGERVN
jgi:hypothetical protein